MTSRFAGLKQPPPAPPAEQIAQAAAPVTKKRPAREGKKAVVGYFSPAASKALAQLALDQDTSIQALLGEAIDDLLRKHGRHPFGER
jgi:hypothetical protein